MEGRIQPVGLVFVTYEVGPQMRVTNFRSPVSRESYHMVQFTQQTALNMRSRCLVWYICLSQIVRLLDKLLCCKEN